MLHMHGRAIMFRTLTSLVRIFKRAPEYSDVQQYFVSQCQFNRALTCRKVRSVVALYCPCVSILIKNSGDQDRA